MLTGMGVANPKLYKGGRKLKGTKHCTILINLEVKGERIKNTSGEEMNVNHE